MEDKLEEQSPEPKHDATTILDDFKRVHLLNESVDSLLAEHPCIGDEQGAFWKLHGEEPWPDPPEKPVFKEVNDVHKKSCGD